MSMSLFSQMKRDRPLPCYDLNFKKDFQKSIPVNLINDNKKKNKLEIRENRTEADEVDLFLDEANQWRCH